MQVFIIIFLVGLSIGGISGYKITDAFNNAAIVKEVSSALENQKKDLEDTYAIEKVAISKVHEQELKDNVIIKEVPKYITKIQKAVKSPCTYTTGTVRLLNSHIEERVPEASTISTTGDATPSEITESTGIKYTHDVLKQYMEWRTLHNELIHWYEKQGK